MPGLRGVPVVTEDWSWRCTCPPSEQCTCGANVPDFGELPPPLPPIDPRGWSTVRDPEGF